MLYDKNYMYKKLIIIFILLQSLVYSQEVFEGDIFISDLSAECIDTTYTYSVMTNSYPPQRLLKKDKLVYEVNLIIKLYGNGYAYENAIALTFKTPDNEITTIIINQDLYPMTFDEKYEYILNIQSREKGWVNVELHEWDVHRLEIKNNINVNFLNYSFYLE
jgi:hypothetical protein